MPFTSQATPEEIKEHKRKCWTPDCKKTAYFEDWTGWRHCFKHWRSDYKYGRCHGFWKALQDTHLRVDLIIS